MSWDDSAPGSSRELLESMVGVAKGREVTSKRISESTDADGGKSQSKVVEKHDSAPNLEALRDLMALRIGGPQDWC